MKNICILFLIMLCSCAVVSAQSGAVVRGVVKDQNGAVVAGADVELYDGVNSIQRVTTDQSGSFNFDQLGKGNFGLRVSAKGFADQSLAVSANGEQNSTEIVLGIEENRLSVTAEVGNAVERQNVPQSISLIGSDQILQRAQTVLAQIGEEEAGLNFQRTSPTIGAVVVRGLTGKNVVTFVDGVRYTTAAQRGGINTFFNLNEPTALQSVEVLRGASSAQYGSDALGGTINLVSKNALLGSDKPEFHGEITTQFNSADRGFGGSTLVSYGTNKFGGYVNLAARRANPLRTANGIDSHSAITRFLGLPSNIIGSDKLPDTAFTQYSGSTRLNYSPRDDQQFVFNYQRSQQDGGKRYDQLLGGDGNLIADLRNLMLDFGYLRYVKQNLGVFDSASFTASFNSQREERVNQGGQGNPLADVVHQYERTSVTGFSFFLDKQLPARNFLTFGGDFYHEKVNAPAFNYSPATNTFFLSRPRVPDESRFDQGGLFVQNAFEAIPNRLRISGALRYGASQYKVPGDNIPVGPNNRPLYASDSLRVGAFSGRIGAVVRVFDQFRVAANYSRGFRYPSITDLGTLGLTGDGFEVDYLAANSLRGTVGTSALATAVSTNLPVEKQRPEYSNNFDLSLRYQNKRFDTELTGFILDINDTITKQALILPQGAVGQFLGSERIISQNPNGAVFVNLAPTTPVLVRSNYSDARIFGIEYELEARLTRDFKFNGNFTYIRAEDRATGAPPNIEGGTPPPTGFVSFRYEPVGKPFWIEFYSRLADKQNRLSSLDLSDRRTGAPRTRAQIQNFFRRGACVRGITSVGTNGQCGSAGGILLATGETLAQVQNRVLPIGATINGVRVLNDNTTVPLYTQLPSYALANLRGAYKFGENSKIVVEFENIFDQQHRNPSWGIDGAGRSVSLRYQYKF